VAVSGGGIKMRTLFGFIIIQNECTFTYNIDASHTPCGSFPSRQHQFQMIDKFLPFHALFQNTKTSQHCTSTVVPSAFNPVNMSQWNDVLLKASFLIMRPADPAATLIAFARQIDAIQANAMGIGLTFTSILKHFLLKNCSLQFSFFPWFTDLILGQSMSFLNREGILRELATATSPGMAVFL